MVMTDGNACSQWYVTELFCHSAWHMIIYRCSLFPKYTLYMLILILLNCKLHYPGFCVVVLPCFLRDGKAPSTCWTSSYVCNPSHFPVALDAPIVPAEFQVVLGSAVRLHLAALRVLLGKIIPKPAAGKHHGFRALSILGSY